MGQQARTIVKRNEVIRIGRRWRIADVSNVWGRRRGGSCWTRMAEGHPGVGIALRKPFGPDLQAHGRDSGNVATWPVEAGDEAKVDRVASGAEDDRNGGGRGLGGKRRGRGAG